MDIHIPSIRPASPYWNSGLSPPARLPPGLPRFVAVKGVQARAHTALSESSTAADDRDPHHLRLDQCDRAIRCVDTNSAAMWDPFSR
ncbi:MAG: hypothetical protein QMA93_04585, partial [Acidimicrobiales bacterium]